jgi:hypothetical protein
MAAMPSPSSLRFAVASLHKKKKVTESGLLIEQEWCKKTQLEVDGLLETCREEKKMRSESEEKLKEIK